MSISGDVVICTNIGKTVPHIFSVLQSCYLCGSELICDYNQNRSKQNGLHAGKLKSYIQLCLAMSQMAKDLRSASPKEQQKENKKFAMRTWLMRMGFIGDEFATARETLTQNLTGDNAFRFGRP